MRDEPVLQGFHLTRSFGDGETRTYALRDVSLGLKKGELALLMGPSGSGKSTLLAVLSGLLEPDSGQVLARVDGDAVDLWKLTPRQREHFRLKHCGFIFQGYNLFPALTAEQQLEIVLRWGEGISGREARERSREMLSLLGLSKKCHLLPAQLSGGEKQRVAIGRALIKNPQFVFADEPTSALDWTHGEQVIELLRIAAHERGATILVVSHDHRIVPFVDTVFHLEDGRLQEAETPVDVPPPGVRFRLEMPP
ncbi:MAG: ABC transporter ATP-binding protein [Gemmataceae bacterium]|nr:ABC transporter ATP-binding protein [Gemmataceae bacterium]